jgi:hypothetical protein
VESFGGAVTVYAQGFMYVNFPSALAIDRFNNLYVASTGVPSNVQVFLPGAPRARTCCGRSIKG